MKNTIAAVAAVAAMSLAHQANAAVTIFQSSGNVLEVDFTDLALPSHGQYKFTFTSSVPVTYGFYVLYEAHWDYYLAPAPRPHSESLDGNTGYVTGSTNGLATSATWLYTVPELTRLYFPANNSQALQFGIPVGTPLYRETQSDDPVFGFYAQYAGPEAFDYTFTVTRVAPIPEPGTWAMLILGFVVTGAALRHARAPWRALQDSNLRPSA